MRSRYDMGCRPMRCWPALLFAVFVFVLLPPAPACSQPGQSDSSIPFDLLLAPPSPGFVLLGIEPASVERPGTPTDFLVTVLDQTDDLDALPCDFALEFAPYWLFAGKGLTYQKYASHRDIGSNLLQTLSFSVATTPNSETVPDTEATSLGIGVRFSLLRGMIDREFDHYAWRLDTLYAHLDTIAEIFGAEVNRRWEEDELRILLDSLFLSAPAEVKPLILPTIEASKGRRLREIKSQVEAEVRTRHADDIKVIRETISRLHLRRIGWKLDVAGGVVFDFPGREFDEGSLSRYGAWLTGGYEWKDWGWLFVSRLLGNYDDCDESSLDLGSRLILDTFRKFSISAEAVYRWFPNRDIDEEEWRFALVFDYPIAKNKSLSFTLGRDFEGREGGNFLSVLNLRFGFGSDRPIP